MRAVILSVVANVALLMPEVSVITFDEALLFVYSVQKLPAVLHEFNFNDASVPTTSLGSYVNEMFVKVIVPKVAGTV